MAGHDYLYVDVHAHLDDESFDEDREEVIKRARDIFILNAGQEMRSNRASLEIARKYKNVGACLGFHPEFILKFKSEEIEEEMRFIRRIVEEESPLIFGISEIGLDFKVARRESEREKQIEFFEKFLRLAEELRLPVIVHSRFAPSKVVEVLKDFNGKVVLHSFPGNEKEIKEAIDYNFYFSIAPNICRSKQKQLLAKLAPVELILTETDSPVLGPTPSERNEPSNIHIVVREVSRIKQIGEEELRKVVLKNFEKVFLEGTSKDF